jgi:ABC-2 type transport system permease protein
VNRVLAVAEQEFRALVRSKAFLVSVVILPVLIFGMGVAERTLSRHADSGPRRFAVVDDSGGRWFDALAARAAERNATLDGRERAPFVPLRVDSKQPRDQVRLDLSAQVKSEQLFAFVEIPAEPDVEPLRYYTDHPAVDELPEWLNRTLQELVRADRYREAHLPPELVATLDRRVATDRLGLWTRDPDGRVHPAEKLDVVKSVIVPMVPPFLLFFFIVVSAPQLMNSVLTEKMSRISEVLLGSVTPFELMLGKLFGCVAVSLLLGSMYLAGGLAAATRMGWASAISAPLVGWFLVFLVLAMLLYGAICIAVGAACTDLKDAQNLMLPVMLPLMIPMLVSSVVVQSPSSPLAIALSLFPPSAPLVMLLRVGLHPSAPLWQVLLAVVLTIAAAIGCVWAAGRVFRVGLLMQGKSASFAQMIRWILTP